MDSSGSQVGDMNPSKLASHLEEAAHLSSCASIVVKEVSARFDENAAEMSTSDFVNCLWHTAWLKDVAPDILRMVPALVDNLPGKAVDMTAKHLSECLWAVATLKDAAPQMLESAEILKGQISGKVDHMKEAQVSQCLWAAQELHDEGLVKIFQDEAAALWPAVATDRLLKKETRAGQLANALRALAETAVIDGAIAPELKIHIMKEIMTELPERAADLNEAQLANSFWGVCALQHEAPEVLKLVPVLVAHAPVKATEMSVSDLCCCLNGVVSLRTAAPEILKILPAIACQIQGRGGSKVNWAWVGP